MRRWGVVAALAMALAGTAAQAGVGVESFSMPDPGGPPIEVGVWYPSDAPAKPTHLGLSVQDVAVGAPVKGRGLPLVVISHGNGGSYGGHYDTAVALAEAGFVVAALTHTGDNYRDQSRATAMWERPRQLKVLIDHMTGVWRPGVVDPKRVGAFGFSSGGFTVLAAAGAKPDMTGVAAHCREHPAFYDCRLMGQRPPGAPGVFVADPRIRAVVSAAPAMGWSLTKSALAGVAAPVQLWRAENDEILPSPFYADAVRANLPRPPAWHIVPGATHFSFLAPCSAQARAVMGPLCADPPGFDREAFHRRFNAEVTAFLRRELAAP
ncbi:prolyl oligopeptidase family serine peptidase [Phenylobacterium sp. J367]|uniref:alpha/beta hydrolase family protein n=1 Tax=Phenylobacterium sp. J367 TaxID=2898435 RepID=UPI00215165B3|nr:prolyl oligopeptidase family serine peptidase [Phenylobacterium sp. J367]MCR5880024.1 prolyl oligopeptidase family serine peptidase [Phenylobacterium sp. J367]